MPQGDIYKITVDKVSLAELHQYAVDLNVLRLDKIHPVISGNKWFKLKYHLEHFLQYNYKGIVTFGGAWSNHIAATAYSCSLAEISCIGIIRGEKPEVLSETLKNAYDWGMEIRFISRDEYSQYTSNHQHIQQLLPSHYIIPVGGAGERGEKGICELVEQFSLHTYDIIVCAIGKGTMWNGLMLGKQNHQRIIGIPVLKGYLKDVADIYTGYHFGGYAKRTNELIDFMNQLYRETGIPTDFVYTGKLMFAVKDLIKQGIIPNGSTVCCIHSGGLQGNTSLPKGTLIF